MNKRIKNIIMALMFFVAMIGVVIASDSISSKSSDYLTKINKTTEQYVDERTEVERLSSAKLDILAIASSECTTTDGCEAVLEWMNKYKNKGCSIICK